jgi:hypothetical protein
MPFPEPETPLAATIAAADEGNPSSTELLVLEPSMAVPRTLNHLHQVSMTYVRCGYTGSIAVVAAAVVGSSWPPSKARCPRDNRRDAGATRKSTQPQALGGCGKTTNVCITVEERPFQGRVKHVESAWASAPVVAVPRKTAFFRSLLEALGFQQHAGHVVVLGSVADEEIEFGHETLEHFAGLEGLSRFNRSQQARFAVLFLARVLGLH